MKLVWCPDIATKAFIDTVKSLGTSTGSRRHGDDHDESASFEETSVAELISALAGGWNAKLIVETWSGRGSIATSTGLAAASRHTGGRHVCVVPDERAGAEYAEAVARAAGAAAGAEVVVGEAEEVMGAVAGMDFLVVDSRGKDSERVLRAAKFGQRGAVVVCKNGGARWRSVVEGGARVVRTAYLPVGVGVEIAHVGASGGGLGSPAMSRGGGRWFRHVDEAGEEHVFRR